MNGNDSSAIDTHNDITTTNDAIQIESIIISEPKICYTSIKYTALENYSAFTNILLVNDAVINYNYFVENSNNHTFPIIYSCSSESIELATFIKTNFKNINRIGIIFDSRYLKTSTRFLNKYFFFNDNDLTATNINDLSINPKFIINLINDLSITNIDYLTCSTLTLAKWNDYYNQIYKFTKTELNPFGVTIGASSDITGNMWANKQIKHIKSIYFKNNITDYVNNFNTLSSTINTSGILYIRQDKISNYIQYSSDYNIWNTIYIWADGTYFDGITSGGCGVMTNEKLTLIFTTDINIQVIPDNFGGIIPAEKIFFICNSENITFDGNFNNMDCVITVDTDEYPIIYPGFIQNGTSSSAGYDNIKIQNIKIQSFNNDSKLYSNRDGTGGWLCQAYFGNNNCIVNNCSSSAPINNNNILEEVSGGGGGILGDYSIAIVNNCFSAGEIGVFAGGIFGSYAGILNSYGIVMSSATNCYSLGTINKFAGGIFGFGAGSNNDSGIIKLIASDCYSKGIIAGGGIFGAGVGSSNSNGTIDVMAINCYSEGSISDGAGGIFGAIASNYNYGGTINILATNCYSEGEILSAGGIFGYGAGNNNHNGIMNIKANKCYSIGKINSYTGGIFGDNTGYNNFGGTIKINATNCYSMGTINTYAGGIFGDNACSSNYGGNLIVKAKNCYSLGAMTDNFAGGIFGANAGTFNTYSVINVKAKNCYTSGSGNRYNGIFGKGSNITTINCYAEAFNGVSQWNTINAQKVLTNHNTIPSTDTIWLNINPYNNTPFLLYGSYHNDYTNFYITATSNNSTKSIEKSTDNNFFWIIPPHLIQLLIIRQDK